jgi:hypothetical protein
MDVLERIRRGYEAIGPGAPRAVLAMFHQEEDGGPEWEVQSPQSRALHEANDVVALDLFGGLPAHWEIIGTDLRMWDFSERRSRLVVGGLFRSRPRGSWETLPLPFIHIWTVSGDQVMSALDYFDGVEVRRRGAGSARRRWWRRGCEAAAC